MHERFAKWKEKMKLTKTQISIARKFIIDKLVDLNFHKSFPAEIANWELLLTMTTELGIMSEVQN